MYLWNLEEASILDWSLGLVRYCNNLVQPITLLTSKVRNVDMMQRSTFSTLVTPHFLHDGCAETYPPVQLLLLCRPHQAIVDLEPE